MSLPGHLLLRIGVESLPAEMLPPALLALADLVRPIDRSNQAFLATVLPVISGLPDPALRKRIASLARHGILMTRLSQDLEERLARPMPLEAPALHDLAVSIQIWGLIAIEMGARARELAVALSGWTDLKNPQSFLFSQI